MIRKIFVSLVVLVALGLGALFWAYGALDKSTEDLKPLYANAESEFLTLPSGATVHYRDEGKADGPVLMLVHGSNASLHTWEPWVARLGDTYRILTLDLPGHGLTGTHESDVYTPEGQVAFVKELVDHLDLPPFVLGGNSMGGGVTLLYAATHPEDLVGIIPVSSGGMPREEEASMPLAFQLAAMPVVNRLMHYITPREIVSEGLRHAIEDDALVTEAMVDRYYNLTLHQGNRAATGERFRGYARSGRGSMEDQIAEIQLPALVIWGENDWLIPVASGRAMAETLPNARLVVYPDVGHIAMEEVPDESAAEVRAFLESLQPAPEPEPEPEPDPVTSAALGGEEPALPEEADSASDAEPDTPTDP